MGLRGRYSIPFIILPNEGNSQAPSLSLESWWLRFALAIYVGIDAAIVGFWRVENVEENGRNPAKGSATQVIYID